MSVNNDFFHEQYSGLYKIYFITYKQKIANALVQLAGIETFGKR